YVAPRGEVKPLIPPDKQAGNQIAQIGRNLEWCICRDNQNDGHSSRDKALEVVPYIWLQMTIGRVGYKKGQLLRQQGWRLEAMNLCQRDGSAIPHRRKSARGRNATLSEPVLQEVSQGVDPGSLDVTVSRKVPLCAKTW